MYIGGIPVADSREQLTFASFAMRTQTWNIHWAHPLHALCWGQPQGAEAVQKWGLWSLGGTQGCGLQHVNHSSLSSSSLGKKAEFFWTWQNADRWNVGFVIECIDLPTITSMEWPEHEMQSTKKPEGLSAVIQRKVQLCPSEFHEQIAHLLP